MTLPLLRTNPLRLWILGLITLIWTSGGQLAAATDLSGCWEGYWQSCTSGHKGPLFATFSKTCDNKYQVTFTGRFFKVLPFRYNVTLNVVSDDGERVTLSGSSYLGRIYGTFKYRATATETKFVSNYYSCKDDGRFVLCRTCVPCNPCTAVCCDPEPCESE